MGTVIELETDGLGRLHFRIRDDLKRTWAARDPARPAAEGARGHHAPADREARASGSLVAPFDRAGQGAGADEADHLLDVRPELPVELHERRDLPHRRVDTVAALAEPPAPRRSAAWHRMRRCMAATCWVRFTTSRAWRAAVAPMETLSWLWQAVERLKTVMGMQALSASAVSAEMASCMPLKP